MEPRRIGSAETRREGGERARARAGRGEEKSDEIE